jgi:pimeloyl-ACP methyl ester carboxylesterase
MVDALREPTATKSVAASPAMECPLVPREYLKAPLPDDCQILQLADGRLMSYAEYGSKSPDAHTIIFCHGIPDCRLDACLLPSDQELAQKLNIRWIGIDRPGLGLSSMAPGRTILDWVDDLKQLLAHLSIDSYYIFSVSGGTAWALAASLLLPHDQIKGVGIMIGVAPWKAGMAGMSIFNRIGYTI